VLIHATLYFFCSWTHSVCICREISAFRRTVKSPSLARVNVVAHNTVCSLLWTPAKTIWVKFELHTAKPYKYLTQGKWGYFNAKRETGTLCPDLKGRKVNVENSGLSCTLMGWTNIPNNWRHILDFSESWLGVLCLSWWLAFGLQVNHLIITFLTYLLPQDGSLSLSLKSTL
jgi:hypothetical protein